MINHETTFIIVLIAIIAIIGLICWLLSLITKKLKFNKITDFLQQLCSLIFILVSVLGILFGTLFIFFGICLFAEHVTNFLPKLFS